MDSDSDAYDVYDGGSDAFEPSPAPKKTTKAAAAKAGAATKAKPGAAAAKPKKKQPLAKRDSNGGDTDPDVTMGDSEAEISFKAPTPKKAANGKTASETYQKLSQLEHVLKRPDTYIGSVEKHTEPLWVYDAEKKQMAYRETTYVPGFYKIFDEILVNAADNKVRDPTMDTLKVTIDREQGSISVWNNGAGIPIEMHSKEKIYIPELIFGNLLTSSNYDDDEAKITGGRNGYGAKLANIYSTEFTVETADKKSEQKYKQTFTDNMHTKGKPKILKNTKKEEFTCITFKPDLKRFGMESMDGDIEALMMKRVYDMAGTVPGIKVILNGERLKVKGFKQYVEMYVAAINELSDGPKPEEDDESGGAGAAKKPSIIYESATDKGKTWEVAFAVSDGQFRQVSFVNNIATIKGGKHVDHVADQVVSKLIEHVTKNKKNGPVKPHQVRQQLWVFVNCQIVNPTFDGQTKETLTLKQSAFGSKWSLTDAFAKKILNSGVVDNILSFAKFKQDQAMKKTDGHKRTRITGIPKLEDANNAGTRKGSQCTLILTEGDSAKALAIQGLSEIGRDNFGVFPLRGKLLNVRDASHDQIMKNAEIKAIKEILGLQHGKQYMDVNSLRYGSIMIMADQDHDGSHIKGLLINFFDYFYPSLMKLPGFLVEFITPIIKATKGKRMLTFFTLPEYQRWKDENNRGAGWHIKYFKGLGTSDSADAKRYFTNMPKHRIPFETVQPGDRELIDLAFNKKKADDRKEWLRQFRPGTYLDYNIEKLPIADFVNKELILFSMADNIRSIPSMVDGFKPGQRKIIFGCYKKNLTKEIKVQQLAGYISEQTAYHHGEQSLYMTIIGLAQNFVGSNNVNLLEPRGQYGTRASGGKDAASARYIFTNVMPITRVLYHQADDALLNYLEDDGSPIEPEWYIPVIPQILLNGSEGIGTGWSSSVPQYNPADVIANLRRRMVGEEMVPMKPWYRGFSGDIEQVAPDKFKVSGRVTKIDDKTYEVTELPIRVWTDSYKVMLEERVAGTDKIPATIREYREYHTERAIHFVIELNAKGQQEIADKGEDAFFKLSNQISTSNMVLFDSDGRIKKYATPEEIMEDFYLLRLSYYQKRKDHLIDALKNLYDRLTNQARFIQMIISRELIVSNRKKVDIVADLRKKDFKPVPKKLKPKVAGAVDDNGVGDGEVEETVDESEVGPDSDFDYLLSMQIFNLTKEKVDKLLKERDIKEEEIKVLLGRTPQNLWDEDLHRFEVEWEKMLEADAEAHSKKSSRGASNGAKAKASVKAKKTAKSGAAARKVMKGSDDEDDLVIEDDDSEDDFKPTAAAGRKKATAAAVKKPSPRKRTAASATLDDDDLAAIGAGPSTSSTRVSSKPASESPPPPKKSKSATPISLDSDDDDDAKLAPVFRKPSAAAKTAKPAGSRSASTSSTAAAKGKATKAATPTAFSLSDDDDDELMLPASKTKAKAKAAPAKKTAASTSAAGKKAKPAPASKRKAKDESDDDIDLSMSQDVDDSVASLPKRSGRARTTARKASYKIDSEDDDDEDY